MLFKHLVYGSSSFRIQPVLFKGKTTWLSGIAFAMVAAKVLLIMGLAGGKLCERKKKKYKLWRQIFHYLFYFQYMGNHSENRLDPAVKLSHRVFPPAASVSPHDSASASVQTWQSVAACFHHT